MRSCRGSARPPRRWRATTSANSTRRNKSRHSWQRRGTMRQAAEAKMGFYPVANEALGLLARAFRVEGETAILDPCAGEGAAIGFLGAVLGVSQERTYAVELAENRAVTLAENLPGAKRLGPARFMGTHVSPNSFGLAWG